MQCDIQKDLYSEALIVYWQDIFVEIVLVAVITSWQIWLNWTKMTLNAHYSASRLENSTWSSTSNYVALLYCNTMLRHSLALKRNHFQWTILGMYLGIYSPEHTFVASHYVPTLNCQSVVEAWILNEVWSYKSLITTHLIIYKSIMNIFEIEAFLITVDFCVDVSSFGISPIPTKLTKTPKCTSLPCSCKCPMLTAVW